MNTLTKGKTGYGMTKGKAPTAGMVLMDTSLEFGDNGKNVLDNWVAATISKQEYPGRLMPEFLRI